MKKIFLLSSIFTLLIIFLPPFLVDLDDYGNINNIETINEEENKNKLAVNPTYKMDIDITKHHVIIYKNDKILKEMDYIEEKKNDIKVPIGNFEVENKGSFFFSPKYNERERYYIKFFSNYLIHSIPIDENDNIIEEGKNKIELPLSDGWIKVSEEDSKWLYNNIPIGTEVVIH